MKALLIVALAGFLFANCTTTKKIPAVTTTVDTRPKVAQPVVVEKPVVKSVIPPSNPNTKMAAISGKWKFESSSERDISKLAASYLPELNFNENDRKVSGSTGCNNLNGFFFTMGEQFNFSSLAVDKKYCSDVSVEKYITGFFRMVGAYKTEGNKMYLIHRNDRSKYLVFTKAGR